MRCIATLAIVLGVLSPAWGQADAPPPPGKNYPLRASDHASAPSYRSGQPIIGTSYFYWYDSTSKAHIRDADGSDALTTHPDDATLGYFSYKSDRWHYEQLRDMRAAGIDIAMPVYWGVPGAPSHWSNVGLPPMVAAHDRMAAEQARDPSAPRPPQIAMFYDTSTLEHAGDPVAKHPGKIDLSTEFGKSWFYNTIRDFFSLIPPAKWARIDGRPIVFLYSASFAKKLNPALFEDTRKRFERDFGVGLYLVRHEDWPGQADAWYSWGGALGLKIGDTVAGLGPGYDHSAVPGRKPLVVDRENGRFYQRQWEQLLTMSPQRRPWLVHIETWNEWHEGTDIARSREFGETYIRLTARYSSLFHDRHRLDSTGPYSKVETVEWTPQQSAGLRLRAPSGDGFWKEVQAAGRSAIISTSSPESSGRYLYFDVDGSFLFDPDSADTEVQITFLDDDGCEGFRIDYDSSDLESGPKAGAFRPTDAVKMTRSGQWRTERIRLKQVRFTGRANSADFRLAVIGGRSELKLAQVSVTKQAPLQSR